MSRCLLRQFVMSFAVFLSVLLYAGSNPALAESQCGPAFGGAIMNFAWECWNDAVILQSQPQRRDSFNWEYVDDTVGDGSGAEFDISGIALKETSNQICVALNSALDFTNGYQTASALNGEVTYGDLFFNFSGLNFQDASDQALLYAVRFDDKNDSGVQTLGVYKNVSAMSVSTLNLGSATRLSYEQYLFNHTGVVAGYGDFDKNMTYLSLNGTTFNEIASGQKIGEIELRTASGLLAEGYDPARFGGPFTVGFCFDKALIVDQCGVFGGDGTTCLDCAQVACGTHVRDECGVCDGDGTSCLDCAGTINGDQVRDICGVCGGDGTSCLDCTGQPFGQAEVDRCGVCGGDGNSCLGCESIDSTKTLFALDSGSAAQSHTLKAVLKKLSKYAKGSKTLSKYIASETKAADKLHNESWSLSWSIPQIAVQCANTAFCVNVDNVSSLNKYTQNAQTLYNKTRTALRKLKDASRGRVSITALSAKARENLNQVREFAKQIPAVRSLCQENGQLG